MPTLSIVIPAYNEERFIGTLLDQVRAVDLAALGVEKEIIVVDDCSTDRTSADRRRRARRAPASHPENAGKGRRSAPGSSAQPATT